MTAKTIKQDVLEDLEDKGTEAKIYLEDLGQHGCTTGMVGHLIYYTDTLKYYEDHKAEIFSLLKEAKDMTGLDEAELFGDRWETLEDIAEDFESEIDLDDYDTQEDYEQAQQQEWANFYENLSVFDSQNNKNLLAWFGYEETARKIYSEQYENED